MKFILSIFLCALILVGFGCSSTPKAEETTEDTSPSWWLTFDLPDGWVMARHYEIDQAIDLNSAIQLSLTDVVLQSTAKNVWIDSERTPTEVEIADLGGEDQVVTDDYTYIRAFHMTSRNVIPSDAEDLGGGFYRVPVSEDCEDCPPSDVTSFDYYLETESEKYKFVIYQNNQELSVAESVIFSATEVSEAD